MAWFAQKSGVQFQISFDNIHHPMKGNWTGSFEFFNDDLLIPLATNDAVLVCNDEIIDDVGNILTYAGIVRTLRKSATTTYVKVGGRTLIPLAPRSVQIPAVTAEKAITMVAKTSPEFTQEQLKIAAELTTVGVDLNTIATGAARRRGGTYTGLGFGFFEVVENLSQETLDFLFSHSGVSERNQTNESVNWANVSIIRNAQNKLKTFIMPSGQIVFGGGVDTLALEDYQTKNYAMNSEYMVIDQEYFHWYDNISAIEYRDRDMVVWF